MDRLTERPLHSVALTDLSEPDDVSALSMTGASVIAARTHASSLHNKTTKGVDKVIPEGDDAENDLADVGEQEPRSSSDMNACRARNSSRYRRSSLPVLPTKPDSVGSNGRLFPDYQSDHVRTFEEWRKSNRKKRHNSKKHHKKDRSNELLDVVQQAMSPLPIDEISFPITRDPSSIHEYHDSIIPTRQRAPSKETQSVASTAESTGSRYQRKDSPQASNVSGSGIIPLGTAAAHTLSSQNVDLPVIPPSNDKTFSSSYDNHETQNNLQSIFQSHSNRDSLSRGTNQSGHDRLDKSCHSVHSSAHSYTSCSHITIEDIKLIKIELERAKVEEIQVAELHSKLENDILTLVKQVEALDKKKNIIEVELKSTVAERERLQSCLSQCYDENSRLISVLRNAEEEEDAKRLDDVLNRMQAKMRALRVKDFKNGKSQKDV
ncbi:hypothetical protein HJC23_003493 [Cyclotella cryptica]|uniref:Uncharacterized protein n=1 Tax=Cyclotella cryptica TaxID=29204 RepID=A0ABD3QST1_9STRA|eukprot:CCRYP_002639-RA/>CCRYP_002639-RA protein AED:0.13 eAED:0.13 QI:0/-1/0/1/-1/1/1/0/434